MQSSTKPAMKVEQVSKKIDSCLFMSWQEYEYDYEYKYEYQECKYEFISIFWFLFGGAGPKSAVDRVLLEICSPTQWSNRKLQLPLSHQATKIALPQVEIA